MSVFIADDDTTLRELLTEVVSREGFSVFKFSNGRELIDEFLRAGNRERDIVFTDLDMPVISGYEVSLVLRQSGCTNPIYIVSGDIGLPDICHNCRATGYVQKGESGMLKIIREILKTSR